MFEKRDPAHLRARLAFRSEGRFREIMCSRQRRVLKGKTARENEKKSYDGDSYENEDHLCPDRRRARERTEERSMMESRVHETQRAWRARRRGCDAVAMPHHRGIHEDKAEYGHSCDSRKGDRESEKKCHSLHEAIIHFSLRRACFLRSSVLFYTSGKNPLRLQFQSTGCISTEVMPDPSRSFFHARAISSGPASGPVIAKWAEH